MTDFMRRTLVAQIAYLEGYISGITDFAANDGYGNKVVGKLQRPLEEVIAPYKLKLQQLCPNKVNPPKRNKLPPRTTYK